MKLFSLGARLALCASMVREGAALADVGTDHAYLPVWLAKKGAVRKAVASDVRPGPLERAREDIEKFGVGGIVEARLSDGLDEIRSEEADDVVIAGMGGELITAIVSRTGWLRNPEKRLILQPMTREEDLRRSLTQQGFSVLNEQAVLEGRHVYTVMLCAYGRSAQPRDGLFPYIGLLSGDTPAGRAYLRREETRLRNRARGLRAEGSENSAAELLKLCGQIETLLQGQPREWERSK